MRIFIISLLVALIATILTPALTQEKVKTSAHSDEIDMVEVNSFEMFWPIVAGKVRGDTLYPLKQLKERLHGIVKFNNLAKVDYQIILAEKRIVEAEKIILERDDAKNALKTLDSGHKNRENAAALLQKISGHPEAPNLKNRLENSLEKQIILLNEIASEKSENYFEILDQNINSTRVLVDTL